MKLCFWQELSAKHKHHFSSSQSCQKAFCPLFQHGLVHTIYLVALLAGAVGPFLLPPKVFVIAESYRRKSITWMANFAVNTLFSWWHRSTSTSTKHRSYFTGHSLRSACFLIHPWILPSRSLRIRPHRQGRMMMAGHQIHQVHSRGIPTENGSFNSHFPMEKNIWEKSYPDHSTPPLLTHPTRILDGPTLVGKHARPNLLLPLNSWPHWVGELLWFTYNY